MKDTLVEFLGALTSGKSVDEALAGVSDPAERARMLKEAAAWLQAAQAEVDRAVPPAGAARAPKAPHAGSAIDRVQIFCDGAARGNPGPAGAGVIIQDGSGEIIKRLGRYLGETTNNVAEYTAVIMGLEEAARMGATQVRLNSDSELIIRQLQGRYKVKAPGLKPLYEAAKARLKNFVAVELIHVRREFNLAADQMANRAVDEQLDD